MPLAGDEGNGRAPAPRREDWLRAAGILAAVAGFPLSGFLFLLTLLSANACGAFADGCDDYGKTAPGFAWFALGTVVAFVMAVWGVVMAVRFRRR